MKSGAQEAEKSLVTVGRAAEEAQKRLDVAFDKATKKLDDLDARDRAWSREHVEGTRRASESTEGFRRSLSSVEGVTERITSKVARLGTAFIGFATVDFVARVAGFSSAMDLLSDATQAAADATRDLLGLNAIAARMESERKAVEDAANAWKALAEWRERAESALVTGFKVPQLSEGFGIGGNRWQSGAISFPGARVDSSGITKLDEASLAKMVEGFRSSFESISRETRESLLAASATGMPGIQRNIPQSQFDAIVGGGQSRVDAAWAAILNFADESRRRQLDLNTVSAASGAGLSADSSIARDLAAAAESLRVIESKARASLADLPILGGLFNRPSVGETSGSFPVRNYLDVYRTLPTNPYYGDQRAGILGRRAPRYQAGLEAYSYEQESARYTLPADEGLPDVRAFDDLMLAARRRSIESDRRRQSILTGDGYTGFAFGGNDQTAGLSRRLGEDIAGGLSTGLMSGNWSQAGEGIVRSIQSSLIQQLIAEPFADFAASLIQQLLSSFAGASIGSSTGRGGSTGGLSMAGNGFAALSVRQSSMDARR